MEGTAAMTTRRVIRSKLDWKIVAICAGVVIGNVALRLVIAMPVTWAALALLGGGEFWSPQVGLSLGLLSLLPGSGIKVNLER